MRWAKIRTEDIANGPGFRVSIYVQGCNNHCPGCFNPETWDFEGGKEFTDKVKSKFLELGKSKKIAGFSILGGEPLQKKEKKHIQIKLFGCGQAAYMRNSHQNSLI